MITSKVRTTTHRRSGGATHDFKASTIARVSLAVVALAIVSATPAAATFPGQNGRIAYARFDPAIEDFALFTSNPNGSHVTRLSPGAGVNPDWSADSDRLAYDFWDGTGVQIVTIGPDGGNLVQLTSGPAVHENASWSPDGKTIVYGQSPPFGDQDPFFTSIYIMNSDGTGAHPVGVVSPDAFDVEPSYSPDGRHIAFMRLRVDVDGNQQMAIHVMRADGSHVRRITRWDYGVEHPKWSPDSRWIIFNGGWRRNPDSGSNKAIYLVHPDGSDLHAIYRVRRGTGLTKPSFSPNGKKVLFVCATTGASFNENLCIMNITGFTVRTVTHTVRNEQQPDWGSAPLH